MRRGSTGPGLLERRAAASRLHGQPTGNFPPTTEPVQTSYCRHSLSCRRRLFLSFPVF